VLTEAAIHRVQGNAERHAAPGARRATYDSGPAAEDFGDVAFRALRAASANLAMTTSAVAGGEKSPDQMFEAGGANAHDRRKAALREEYESAIAERASDFRDETTGIDARRASAEKGSRGAAESPHADGHGHGAVAYETDDARGGLLAPGSSSDAPRREGTPLTTTVDSGTNGTLPQDGGSAGSRARQAASVATDGAGPNQARAATPAVPGMTPTNSVAGGDAAGDGAENPARQVGRILAGARSAALEQSRGTLTGPAGDMARPGESARADAGRVAQHPSNDDAHNTRSVNRGDSTQASEFARLISSIRLRGGLSNSSARLRLHPPQLGRIRVDVQMQGEQLRIDVCAETAEARSLLTRRAAELRGALQQHGVQVDRFEVTLDISGDAFVDQMGGREEHFASSPRWEGQWPESSSQREQVPEDGTRPFAEEQSDPAIAAAGDARLDIRV